LHKNRARISASFLLFYLILLQHSLSCNKIKYQATTRLAQETLAQEFWKFFIVQKQLSEQHVCVFSSATLVAFCYFIFFPNE